MKNLLALCFLMASGFAITACAQTNADMSRSSADLRDFDGIALGISADVYVSQGDYNVEITGPEKSIDKVELEVNGGTLGIGTKRGTRNWNSRGVKVYVTMPNLSSIAIGGSGDVKVEDAFNNMGKLSISVGGSGNVDIAGKAKSIEISVAGSGDVDASGVDADRAEISIAGSGNVKVGTVDKLEASIAGSGDVYYKGNPSVKKSVVGSGDIRKL
jgi:hypothetical protein